MAAKLDIQKIRPLALLGYLGWICFLGIYLRVLSWIFLYAVNVPVGDEWVALFKNAFEPSAFSWLFIRQNEHLVVPSKILIKVLFFLNDWNLWSEQVISYVLFGGVLGIFALLAKKIQRELSVGVILAFLVFLLSNAFMGNHGSGYNSMFHFALLFKLLTILLLFQPNPSWGKYLGGVAAALLCVLSHTEGIGAVAAILAVFVFFKLYKIGRQRAEGAKSSREARALLIVAVLLVGILAISCIMFRLSFVDAGHFYPFIWSSSLAFPNSASFWWAYGLLVGRGLGVLGTNFILMALAFIILIAAPLFILLRRRQILQRAEVWMLFAGIASTLGELACISIGRANVSPVVIAFVMGPYCEISFFLMAWAGIAWAKALEGSKHLALGLAMLLGFFAIQSRGEWNYWYKDWEIDLSRKMSCLKGYYEHEGSGICTDFYPTSVAKELDRAKELNLSFYREVMKNSEPWHPTEVDLLGKALREFIPKKTNAFVMIVGRDSNLYRYDNDTIMQMADLWPGVRFRKTFASPFFTEIFEREIKGGRVNFALYQVDAVIFIRHEFQPNNITNIYPSASLVEALEKNKTQTLGLKLVKSFQWERRGHKQVIEVYSPSEKTKPFGGAQAMAAPGK